MHRDRLLVDISEARVPIRVPIGSPRRTIRQSLQNNFQPLSACLVVLRIVFKNLSPTQDPNSRFSQDIDVSFRLFQKEMFDGSLKR